MPFLLRAHLSICQPALLLATLIEPIALLSSLGLFFLFSSYLSITRHKAKTKQKEIESFGAEHLVVVHPNGRSATLQTRLLGLVFPQTCLSSRCKRKNLALMILYMQEEILLAWANNTDQAAWVLR